MVTRKITTFVNIDCVVRIEDHQFEQHQVVKIDHIILQKQTLLYYSSITIDKCN